MKEKSELPSKKKNAQGRDEYKSTAAFYDILFSKALSSIRRNICIFLKNCHATNVLDICCGTGEQLRLLADTSMHLTGVDLSKAMLFEARKKSPTSINYLETDAAEIPLPDNEYDGIIISLALHEKSRQQREAIFSEACRVLTKKGHIIIADYCTPSTGFASQFLGKILIPAIEKAAGSDHYNNYTDWMKRGAIRAFLERNASGQPTQITSHFKDCIQLLSVAEYSSQQK